MTSVYLANCSTTELPNHVPALGNLHVAQVALLLNVEERDGVGVPQEQHPRSSVEDLVAVGQRQLLGHLVLEVLDDQGVGLVQHGETVSCDPDGG